MANVKIIANAKLQAMGIEKFFGVSPDLDIQEDYVRIYYAPDKLIQARQKFESIMEAPPGEIRYDLQPIINPYVIKKYGLPLMGLIALGFVIGRYT